ncbi:lipopolysaccharide biosynthesis protein [Sphingomonas sp. RRHST34]|uniref:Lipopolysaccharide biosynthesis protein n=1 Tax=Sphingomonas citri TaxID=2862499 RepID=A0ABS7BMS6_9SPHN|nr:Wzz/FepE/Etk N-terminal domain-containing protein [Sphingomonas citri]MBW6530825.1 lipopolysaccharide biosynthesis protein [Sphingomonas citri]
MSDVDTNEEEGGGAGFFGYIPTILWQRRWLIIVPFVVLSTIGVALALLLPPMYRSSATLLVESQELPSTLVSSPLTTIIDQRIAKIREQVLSRGDLIALIEQNNLYEKERRSKPLSEIVETMQKATAVQAVSGDIGQGQQAQNGGTSTIAFTMSFDYADPAKAQAVMQSIVSRFLEIDATTMAAQATNTVDFLQDQSRKLQDQIGQIEGQITQLKARNGLALSSGGIVMPSNSSGYSAQIAQLQSENRALLAQSRKSGGKDPLVQQAEQALIAARAVYNEGHPDVIRAKARLAQAQEIAKSQGDTSDTALVQSQIQANNAQIAQLESYRASDNARASASLANSSRAPVVMEQVNQLEARASGLRDQLKDITGNVLRAQNSARMAQEQKGERLTVVDPPASPDRPVSPNRLMLIGGGVAGGLGLGLVLALALEFLMRPIRGVDQLKALGLETLTVVPTFTPDLAPGQKRRRWLPGLPFRRKPRLAAESGGAL